MALWPRALSGPLLACLRLRAAAALHVHGEGGAEGAGDELQAALQAAQASLDARGASASGVSEALRRSAADAALDLAEESELLRREDPSSGPAYRTSSTSNASRHQVSHEAFNNGRDADTGEIPAYDKRYDGVSDNEYALQTRSLLRGEVGMLSDSQKEKLAKIQSGSIGKKQIEIVLAHYNESIGWSSMYDSLLTPYCKGNAGLPYPWTPRDCRSLPNVGREAHTFLHHIVQNYNSLADWTVFSQAQAPTAGWSGASGDHLNGHIYPGATFHDYVLGEGPFAGDGGDDQGARFVFNGQWKPPHPGSHFDLIRMCFAGNYYVEMREDHKPERLNKTCLKLKSVETQLWLGGNEVNQALLRFIDMIGAGHERKFFYSQGARFALSRDRIRQRPREFYEKLIGYVDKEVYPIAGIFSELLWYYIAGKPEPHREPCKEQSLVACPEGFEQLGKLGDHAGPGGRWEGALQRLKTGSMAECATACHDDHRCGGFEYRTHHPKLCVLQPRNNTVVEAQIGFWAGAITCKLS